MNEILLIIEILVVFGALFLTKKLFGKTGLFVWIAIASIIANIEVVKNITLFGMSASLGNVMFASNFLATDILVECYGKDEAKKGVYIGTFAIVLFLICMQLSLLFVPNEFDVMHGAMEQLFAFAPRVCISSVVMCFIANYTDVLLFHKLREKAQGKHLWLRNNLSTIVCNSLENFGFFFIAFAGIYPIKTILLMGATSCVIEIMIALCDTPFLYLAKSKFGKEIAWNN